MLISYKPVGRNFGGKDFCKTLLRVRIGDIVGIKGKSDGFESYAVQTSIFKPSPLPLKHRA